MKRLSVEHPIETDLTGEVTGQWSSLSHEDLEQKPENVYQAQTAPRWRSGLISGAALFVALLAIGLLVFGPMIEKTLKRDTDRALQRAAVVGAEVSYDGRDATVRLPPGADQNVARIAAKVRGRRIINMIESEPSITPTTAPTTVTVPVPTVSVPSVPVPTVPTATSGDVIIPEEGSINQDPVVEPIPASLTELQATIDELIGSQTIEFSSGGAVLTAKGLAVVNGLARLVNESSATVQVTAFADDAPSPSENQGLSNLRAEAVRAALVKAGVVTARIQANGAGQGQTRVQIRVVLS